MPALVETLGDWRGVGRLLHGPALARALVEADCGHLELSRARPAMFTIFLPAARADDVVAAPRPARTSAR